MIQRIPPSSSVFSEGTTTEPVVTFPGKSQLETVAEKSILSPSKQVPGQKRTPPIDGTHITYQLQYRKCGKAHCSSCHNGQGHGPYWYAYWREDGRLRSGYIGKIRPDVDEEIPLSCT